MLLAIENWRTGLPNALVAQNAVVQTGMQRAGFKETYEGGIATRPLVKL